MKLLFALVLVHAYLVRWSAAVYWMDGIGALTAQKQQMGLLQTVDYDDYCGDDCCLSADARETIEDLAVLVESAPDSNGDCYFNESLFDSVFSDHVLVALSLVPSAIQTKSVFKPMMKQIVESCATREYHDYPITPMAFPGGSKVVRYTSAVGNPVVRRAVMVLDSDCKVTVLASNLDSCYAGCAGLVNKCPVAYPYSAPGYSPEIQGLYDDYMCFNTEAPPAGVSFEDLGLCEDDQGSDDQGSDDQGSGDQGADDQGDNGHTNGGTGLIAREGAPVP